MCLYAEVHHWSRQCLDESYGRDHMTSDISGWTQPCATAQGPMNWVWDGIPALLMLVLNTSCTALCDPPENTFLDPPILSLPPTITTDIQ